MGFFNKVKNFFTGKKTEIVASTGTKPVYVIQEEFNERSKERQDKLNERSNKRSNKRLGKLEANKTPRSENSKNSQNVSTGTMGRKSQSQPKYTEKEKDDFFKAQAKRDEEKRKDLLNKSYNLLRNPSLSPEVASSLADSLFPKPPQNTPNRPSNSRNKNL